MIQMIIIRWSRFPYFVCIVNQRWQPLRSTLVWLVSERKGPENPLLPQFYCVFSFVFVLLLFLYKYLGRYPPTRQSNSTNNPIVLETRHRKFTDTMYTYPLSHNMHCKWKGKNMLYRQIILAQAINSVRAGKYNAICRIVIQTHRKYKFDIRELLKSYNYKS